MTDSTGPSQGLSTKAVHAGESRQKPANSLTDPIFCTATYTFPNSQAVRDFVTQKQPRDEYARYSNPGERVAEGKLAALDGGDSAVLYASGMAAIAGLLLAKLRAGDEIVLFDECYYRTRELCVEYLNRFGIVGQVVPTCDYEALERAITPATRLLLTESPTNPHLSVVDLERFVALGENTASRRRLTRRWPRPTTCGRWSSASTT